MLTFKLHQNLTVIPLNINSGEKNLEMNVTLFKGPGPNTYFLLMGQNKESMFITFCKTGDLVNETVVGRGRYVNL